MKKKNLRETVYEKCNGHCGYCGDKIEIKAMQVDHIIPQAFFLFHLKNKHKIPEFLSHLTETDVNHIDNLMPACRICNKWKDTFCLDSFKNQIIEQIKRLNDYSANYRFAKKYGLVEETPKPVQFYFETIAA